MENRQVQQTGEARKTIVYVIDKDFRVVYLNDELKKVTDEVPYGSKCYEALCGEPSQCRKCPLREENHGKSVLFNRLCREWFSVSSSPVEWPGAVDARIMLADQVQKEDKSFVYNAVKKSDYDELLELNYTNDTYRVIHHGQWTLTSNRSGGKLSEDVRKVAEERIHPDDRQRFQDFWLMDRIGMRGVPEETLTVRHGEFRKLQSDGTYAWVQQLFLPARQSSNNAAYVMSLFNTIENASHWAGQEIQPGGGLYGKEEFFAATENLLQSEAENNDWCMISVDVENLKLFNEWYGREAGDEVIEGIAGILQIQPQLDHGVAGYFGNDDFALVTRNDQETIQQIYQDINSLLETYGNKTGFLPAIGVYPITDPNEPAFTMYDRAELARTSVKGSYTARIGMFDVKMLENLSSRYVLYSDIQRGLAEREFTFFLQPKCNMETGKITGAEALVRWFTQDGTMVSPASFIPFLEKTGFIAELDPYIWEEVCKWQRKLIDQGYQPVPVSVNVSRVDIYSMDVAEKFQSLILKYDLEPRLIEVEITESTYTEDDEVVAGVVARLRAAGFRVLMDDFGSGYSSLNMLKEVEVDVLKIDMRFLKINDQNASKGMGILEAMCNMARLMGIGIIVEGVETADQKAFLLRMGCGYGQGYYFYRPLPIREFEHLLQDDSNLDRVGFRDKKIQKLNLKELLGEDLFSEAMVSNMLGPILFFDLRGSEFTIRRYNDLYADLVHDPMEVGTSFDIWDYLNPEDQPAASRMAVEARNNRHEGAEGDFRRHNADGTETWLHFRTFFLREQDGRASYYSTIRDVTDIYQKNDLLTQQNNELKFLNNDMPGGYYRHDNTDECKFIHVSQRFLDIVGYTREEIEELFDDKYMNMIHPEDRKMVLTGMDAMEQSGGNYAQTYRVHSKSGYIHVTDQSRLVRYGKTEFYQGIILCCASIDGKVDLLQNDDEEGWFHGFDRELLPCGVYRAEADGKHRFGYVSSSMLAMLGYTWDAFHAKFPSTEQLVYWKDRPRVDADVVPQIAQSDFVTCEHRIEMADGTLKWVYSRGRMTTDVNGKRWFYVCCMDSDGLKDKYRAQERDREMYQAVLGIPGTLTFDYSPKRDQIVIRMADDEGRIETQTIDNFVGGLSDHSWFAQESGDLQRRTIASSLQRPTTGSMEFRARFLGANEYRWYRGYFKSLGDAEGKVYRVVGRADEIEQEKQSLHLWKSRAMQDSLTGLLNNVASKEAIARCAKEFESGTLFLVDLDDFKGVNDNLGHMQGDIVLKNVANAIRTTFRKEDILARQGGDEFLIFMPEVCDPEVAGEKAKELLEKIRKIRLPGKMSVRCSIGVAVESDHVAVDRILHQADTALYQAKRGGKNTYAFFGKQPVEVEE